MKTKLFKQVDTFLKIGKTIANNQIIAFFLGMFFIIVTFTTFPVEAQLVLAWIEVSAESIVGVGGLFTLFGMMFLAILTMQNSAFLTTVLLIEVFILQALLSSWNYISVDIQCHANCFNDAIQAGGYVGYLTSTLLYPLFSNFGSTSMPIYLQFPILVGIFVLLLIITLIIVANKK